MLRALNTDCVCLLQCFPFFLKHREHIQMISGCSYNKLWISLCCPPACTALGTLTCRKGRVSWRRQRRHSSRTRLSAGTAGVHHSRPVCNAASTRSGPCPNAVLASRSRPVPSCKPATQLRFTAVENLRHATMRSTATHAPRCRRARSSGTGACGGGGSGWQQHAWTAAVLRQLPEG